MGGACSEQLDEQLGFLHSTIIPPAIPRGPTWLQPLAERPPLRVAICSHVCRLPRGWPACGPHGSCRSDAMHSEEALYWDRRAGSSVVPRGHWFVPTADSGNCL